MSLKKAGSAQQPLLQRSATPVKLEKTGWYLFRKVKLLSMIRNYLKKQINSYRQKKALSEFRIRPYEHTEPQVVEGTGL